MSTASPLGAALKSLVSVKAPVKEAPDDDDSDLDRDLEDIYDDFERATDKAARAKALKAFVQRSRL